MRLAVHGTAKLDTFPCKTARRVMGASAVRSQVSWMKVLSH
jgi:hypothetical protein